MEPQAPEGQFTLSKFGHFKRPYTQEDGPLLGVARMVYPRSGGRDEAAGRASGAEKRAGSSISPSYQACG